MKICLVSSGLEEGNRQLQPWRYLFEIAETLAQEGHTVCLISDKHRSAPPQETVAGLPVVRPSAWRGQCWRTYAEILRAVEAQKPELLLWHMGITSFLHLSGLQGVTCPVVGIFTSPVYRPGELLAPGLLPLLRGYRLSAVHLLGLLVPRRSMRRAMDRARIQRLVVECKTTYARLLDGGIPAHRLQIFQPGIDHIWLQTEISLAERARKRQEMGLPRDDFVVAYFGPPDRLRGLPTLLKAISLLQNARPAIRALILSRQRDGDTSVGRIVRRLNVGQRTHIVSGFLAQDELVHAVAACDAVALPFQIIPSDVPLSVLEAMALGLPLITTDVACLPELVPAGAGILIPPGKPGALATAIATLAQDRALRARLAAAARQRAIAWEMVRHRGPMGTSPLNHRALNHDDTYLHLPGRR
ncbi:MAG: glycosyltransferase family 4 protein [Anaerolineae bacterium]